MSLAIFEDRKGLSRAVARALVDASQRATRARGRFALALAGGSTPALLYEILATEHRDQIPWAQTHLFWSDERYVPSDHRDSNYRMVRETLLDSVPLAAENVHAPDTAAGSPDESAARYERTIRDFYAPKEPGLDWILLGLGEDGHIASLFPGAPALEETQHLVVAVTDSPKPPPVRVTMTLPLINGSREVHFLVSGESKRAALAGSRGGGTGTGGDARLPAQRVRRDATFWWVDRDAART